MKLWKPALGALLVMLALLVRVLTWHLHEQASSLEHLTPHGERLFAICCFAAPCVPGLAILWAALTRRIVTRLVVTLVLLVLAGLAMPVMFLGVLPPMFGGDFTKSVASPSGEHEAHVFVDAFLGCRATLYVSERRALWGTFVEARAIGCDSEGVAWAGETPSLVGTGAPPLPFLTGPR